MVAPRIMLLQILAACPAPAPPQWTMRLPMFSRIGFARANASSEPPHMKVSVPPVAPPTPPETGASRVSTPAAAPASCALLGAVDIDGRAIDDERALGRRGKEIGMSREHVAPGREHGDDRVGARDSLAGARRDGDAGCGGRRLRGVDKIEARDRVARLDEIRGHRRAHVAEADECDFGHGFPGRLRESAGAKLSAKGVEAIISRLAVNAAKSGGANLRLRSALSNKL